MRALPLNHKLRAPATALSRSTGRCGPEPVHWPHRLLLPKPLNKRIKYYRNHLAPGLDEVRLRGFFAATELDGNKEAYREMLLAHAARAAARADAPEGAAPEPEAFATPMPWYDARTMRRFERSAEAEAEQTG